MTVTDITTRSTPETDRQPPHDIDAEQIVLGACILDPRALLQVAEIITPLDLYRPAHQVLFQTLLDMSDNGQPLGPVAVADELGRRKTLTKVGGAPYLHELVASVPTVANGGYYAGIVAEKSALRGLVSAGTRIAQVGYEGTGDVEELYDHADTILRQVTSARETAVSDTERLGDDAEFIDRLSQPLDAGAMIPTPYRDLTDCLAGGIKNGELVCIAGRTGAGKSVMGLDLSRHAAIRHGLPTLYVSLEMPRELVRERIYAAEARVGLHAIKHRTLGDADWDRLAKARPDITSAPLYIATPASGTLALIRQRLQTMERRGQRPRLLAVDHVGLMASVGRVENRYNEVSAYSRGLKSIAMEFDIPVLMLCQVKRPSGQQRDSVPRIDELRDSGELEQSSDIVIMVHREDYDVSATEHPRAGEVDLYVAKNRSGPKAVITIAGQLHYARFVDMARG